MSTEEDTTTCDSEEFSEDSSDVQEFPGYSCGESATHVRDYAAFPIQTRLQHGRPSIIIDPGSVGNLCGDRWAKEVALMAKANGRHPTHHLRERALQVSGVGNGSQKCHYDCDLPVAIRPVGQGKLQNGVLKVPAVEDSDLPGLMGLTALKKNKAILDFNTLTLYFCSDTQYSLEKSLPKGTDQYQLETAPSGHLVLPCCEYKVGSDNQDYSLTLMTESTQPSTTAVQQVGEALNATGGGRPGQSEATSSIRGRSPPLVRCQENLMTPAPGLSLPTAQSAVSRRARSRKARGIHPARQ